MKNLKERWKRAAAIGLAAIMLTAQLPVTAFAEEAGEQAASGEPVTMQDMTAASEAPEQTEDKAASEAPEQPESEAVSGTPEEPGDKTGDEAPVGTTGPVEQSNPTEAAKDGSEDETEKQDVQEADKTEAASDGDKEKEGDKASEEKKTPAFKESRSVDGVKITAEAEEGVFTEGAVLSVEKVTAAEERKAEEAVEDKRPEEQNVAASYTYDIKVLDKDGNEIQPADESKVKVSFTLEEVADANLTTNVYHIVEEDSQNGGDSGEAAPKEGDNPENGRNEEADAVNSAELTAEKLEVETDSDTAIVETDGFSLYTVEFTYDSMQYVLPGDSEVALSDILEAVGLSGNASAVEVSKSSLFSAEKNEGGEWIVTARRAFSSEEWMKVTINNKEYKITVTDDSDTMSFDELQTLINNAANGDTVKLEKDVKWKNSIPGKEAGDSGPLVIPEGKTVTLDLNGHTIDRGPKGWNGVTNANVITVSGNLTLTDGSADGTGKLTGGNTTGDGGGVFIDQNATFTMEGGSITDCITQSQGGGVNVNGTFNMTGGTISGCTANNGAGGGVKVSKGTFNMTGGTISGCTGRGVFVDSSGTFTMSGGARIDGCTYASGGGVYVNGGTFTMEGSARITSCTATNGADNAQGGGGVYVYGGTFKVSGTPVISGNKKGDKTNNVVLNDSKTITVTGALEPGAEIWVNADKGVAFAENGDSYSITDTDLAKFHSDKDSSLVAVEDSDGKVKFFNPWGALQAKFNNASTDAGNTTLITLTGDVTASGNETALVIPAGRYVTLNLNGHTIDRGLASQPVGNNDNVITVSGNLTLTDSSTDHTGTITGGNNGQVSGGGVSVNGGTFTMDGGTISGCNAARGGGVNVDSGTFTMTGGTITGCNAFDSGGGVCVNGSFTMNGGTFTMTGGTITDCNATSHGGRGGGVYVEGGGKFTMVGGTITDCNATNDGGRGGGVYNHGTFNMSGGTISGCSATDDESNGGGVYIEYGGTFKVSGTPVISGNMKGSTSANNVELGGKTISVNGALTSGAEIHVNAGLGVPIAEKGGDRTTALTETEAGYFKCDQDSQYKAGLNENGQVVFKTALPAIANATGLTYNGTEQTPALTFSGDPAPELTAGTDYTVSYKKVVEGTETSISGAPRDAGTYKAVATGKGSYAGTSEAEFTIARKEVTVSSGIAAKDRPYDGTINAELITRDAVFTGKCTGDSLTVSGNGAFADASAGDGKTVTISDLTLGGTSSGNYILAGSGNQITATANITKATPTIITNPEAAAITYGNTLSDSNLTNGAAKLGETSIEGSFAWSDNTIAPAVSDSNKTEYTVTFTPNDSSNLNTTTCQVKLTVNKADIRVEDITEPTMVTNLTYIGQSLPIITAGSVSGNIGTMQYALGTGDAAAPASGWSAAVPKGTNAGTYYVWYKVTGDPNHNDVDAVSLNGIEIAKADYTNNTVFGNTKYGLSGKVELKDCIAPGGTLGTMTVSDPDAVLEGEPSLSDTVLSYQFWSLSENVGKKATVTVSVNNATNHKDYEIVAILNVINCDHAHTELQGVKTGNCTEEGYSGDIVCTECGSIIEYGHPTAKIPDAHDFDEGTKTKEPTTITKGETTYRCRRCGYEKVAQDIPCVEEEGKDYDDLRKDVEGLSGDKAPRISVSENEAGDSVETVIIGGEEVSKTVTDKETGKETIVSKVWIGGLQDSYSYTGSAIKPAFHVYDGTTQLAEKTDYTVSYKNNKDAGAATIEIKFKGNYKDTKAQTLNFTIAKAELGKDIIAHEVGVAQKKSAQKPVPVLTWADTGKTVSSKNFDISYSPSPVKAAGEYTATITPKSGSKNFSGSTTVRLVVTTKDKVLSNAKVTFEPKNYAYTGSAITPKYYLKMGDRTLTENTDYKLIDICNNTAPGTATVIFEGTGSYVGTKTATFKISGKIELNDSSDFTYTYDAAVPFVKGGAKPGLSVHDNRNRVNLKEGKDYAVSYSKNKSIGGTPTIKIKGKGTYKGNVFRSFTITQQDISKLNITAADQFVKRSKLKKASVTIYDTDENKLSSGKDFLVGANGTPAGDENTGTVTVDVTGAGNYTGKAAATFRYLDVSANIGKAGTKKIADQSYTGNAVKLSYADLTNVLYTGKKSSPKYLIPGTDFEIVSYSNNIKRGTAKVVLKGKGSYAGTKTLSFKIVQRKVDYTGKL